VGIDERRECIESVSTEGLLASVKSLGNGLWIRGGQYPLEEASGRRPAVSRPDENKEEYAVESPPALPIELW
jgi:hypothetical protein